MTGDHDEVIGKLSEELTEAMAAGEIITPSEWAERFGVHEDEVIQCQRGLEALVTSLGEEMVNGHPELPQPELPSDFEVVSELGRGGMGVVYRARQRSLDRDVAIKVLRPGDLVFGDALRRFRAEARSLARLRHRHIVSVYDSGETPEGLVWFAMDLVDGKTLAEELQSRGRMLPARATKIIRQVTSAVAHAHAQGIVHRDLKPQNVLIDGSGDAFVVDFGLARDASSAGTNTMSGELLGTPTYMSPEQARGDAANIGEGCDVWALGTLLYEMLIGRAPYAGKPLHETIRAILHDETPPMHRGNRRVPEDLEAICQRALQKVPEDRYVGAIAFGEDVERFQDGRGVLAEKPTKTRQFGRTLRRHKRAIASITAAVAVTLLAVTAWLPTIRRDAVISEAQRLTAAGHPQAAMQSLRSVMTDKGSNGYPELQLDLFRAQNDHAGELLMADNEAGAVAIASQILPNAHRLTHDSGIIWNEDWHDEQAMRWELVRCAAIALPTTSPMAVDPVKLADDLSSGLPGRMALARLVAAQRGGDLSAFEPSLQVEIVRDGLRAQARRLAANPESDIATDARWGTDVDASWSPAIEDALAATATNKQDPDLLRALAFRAWCLLVGLPAPQSLHTSASQPSNAPTPAQVVAAAPKAIEQWRTWRYLTREQACQARINLLAQAMAKPGELLPVGEADLRASAELWTGHATSRVEQFQTWWQLASKRPYAEVLRDALSVPADEEVTVLEALDQSATAALPVGCLWRQLAWLQVPDGLRIPEYSPEHSQSGDAWRKACLEAAGQEDTRKLTLRSILLRFDNGSCTPEVVAEQQQPALIGQDLRIDMHAKVAERSWLSLRTDGDDDGRHAAKWRLASFPRQLPIEPAIGEITASREGRVRIDQSGLYLQCANYQFIRTSMPWGGIQNSEESIDRIWIGTAAASNNHSVVWDWGHRITSFVLLVALHDANENHTTDLPWWREAVAKTFDAGAKIGGERLYGVDWTTASLWPMPTALDAIKSFGVGEQHTKVRTAETAELLAGKGRSFLAAWPRDYFRPDATFGVRLVSGSANEEVVRDAITGLTALADSEWTFPLGQQLLNTAAEKRLQLPTVLRARIEALPTPGGLIDCLTTDHLDPNLLWTLILIAGIAWWCVSTPRDRRRKVAIWLAAVFFLMLQVRIEVAGAMLTPTFALTGALTVCIAMCGPGGKWLRPIALLVTSLITVFAASSYFFHTEPALHGYLAFAVWVGFVPPHRQRPIAGRAVKKAARSPKT